MPLAHFELGTAEPSLSQQRCQSLRLTSLDTHSTDHMRNKKVDWDVISDLIGLSLGNLNGTDERQEHISQLLEKSGNMVKKIKV